MLAVPLLTLMEIPPESLMHRAAILLSPALFAACLCVQTMSAQTTFTQATAGSGIVASTTLEAQNSASIAGSVAGDEVPAGTQIRAALDTPLSTKTSKAGDRFTATLTEPVNGSNGVLVLAGGARVEGEVAEADESRMSAAFRGKSKLSLRFRDIVSPGGQTIPLTATLISVNDTGNTGTKIVPEPQAESGMRSRNAVAGDSGARAGGLPFGHPLKGLAVGAMAGGGYVLAVKSKEVNLPAQTGLVIRLDQPVSSPGNANPMPR